MNYREAVAEGKRLSKRSEEDQWRLAELTAEVLASGKKQREWAADIGVAQSHVSVLSRVWERFGDSIRRPRFNDAYATVSAASEEIVGSGALRSVQAQRQLPSRHGDKVEMLRKLAADEEVAADAFRDQRTRATVARASMRVASEQVEEQRSEQTRRAPDLTHRSSVYNTLGRLTSARRQVVTTLDQLREIELEDEDREVLLEVAEQLETAVDWLMSYIRSGVRSFDKELDRLLQEG